ncbi:MAG: hypothetical protein HQL80_13590, partial [Magnetococcales bacterium]|nr:hypothetical protein [Magnetococcales bacterium]
CHDKGKKGWSESVHANSSTANMTYKSAPASLREFDTTIKVWEAACLNCHDTHTVPGSRRLLREGTDSTTSPKQGGKPAVEETCYQCHTTTAETILTTPNSVPDIKTDFRSSVHMPIVTADQPDGNVEVHDIKNADFEEEPLTLGKGDLSKRHTECTDCHNPHRAMKNRLFDGNGATTAATHLHDTTARHSHLASGALRGTWGVEPDYSSFSLWGDLPSYAVKKGDAGVGASTLRTAGHVTREYQICLKCHSDYGYNDDKVYPAGATRPALGSFTGGTPSGTNGLTRYTNQAMEFAAKANDALTGADQGEPGGNHRSWHPVLFPTGRTLAVRGGMANTMWLSPWNRVSTDVGNLTMYCSDCHGSTTASGTVVPNTGKPWGPHGSTSNFILKGPWSSSTGTGQAGDLCFKCHDYSNYATRNSTRSGFCCEKDTNLHGYHADKIGRMRCTWCHVAVPHGWKNKAFLVNLNDVGPEGGKAAGTQMRNGTTAGYNNAPYYQNAILKIRTWKASGSWNAADCGSTGAPGNGTSGRNWMKDSSENCANPP